MISDYEDVRYRVLRDIKPGGMGMVRLAEDNATGELVAIKFIDEDTTTNLKLLAKLLREEFKLQHKLSPENAPHPNIVYIRDIRPFGDGPVIVMEFVDGMD